MKWFWRIGRFCIHNYVTHEFLDHPDPDKFIVSEYCLYCGKKSTYWMYQRPKS